MWQMGESSTSWPDPLEFGAPLPPKLEPDFEGLKISVPIGAEIKKNGSSSPFDLSPSEDSDSNGRRWEPAELWGGKYFEFFENS